MDVLEFDPGTAKFDLTIELTETEQGTLAGKIEYATDLFRTETIKRMIGHFQTILDNVVKSSTAVSDVPLLTKAERQHILVQWNDTQINYAAQGFLPRSFETQVQRSPDAVAIVFMAICA